MRADRACEQCGLPVRHAVRLDIVTEDCEVWVDPRPRPDGDVWVEWFDCGVPYILVAADNRPIPNNVPLRYRLHECV